MLRNSSEHQHYKYPQCPEIMRKFNPADDLLNVICIILHSVADSEDISGVFRLHIFLTKFEE